MSIGMTLLLLVGVGFFVMTARQRWALMNVARAETNCSDRPADRLAGVWTYMFGQRRMFRYWSAGVAHAFIFGGFVVLGLRTLTLIARGYTGMDSGFGFWLFDDDAPLGAVYLLLKDLVGVLVIVGVTYFLYVRLFARPKRMELSAEGIFILLMILGLVFSDAFYEATGMVIAGRQAGLGGPAYWVVTPFASLVAAGMQFANDAANKNLHVLGFWGHTIIVLVFLNFLPYGKHFHIITVLPNVYFRKLAGVGRLSTIRDIEGKLEREETLGVKTAEDFSRKHVLDFYTCTECGRCSDHCPATSTGKLLSPKNLTIDLRDHLYQGAPSLLALAAARFDGDVGDGNGDLRDFPELTPATVDPEVLWACTTCGACEQECPVFITYVDKIVDMRRNLVMEQGDFPDQLQNAFRGLESVGNPYSFDNEQRAAWAEGLNVPLLRDKPDAEVLFWVGCAPSFDDRSRKIARAMAQLMQRAGVDFAILGPEEKCTGDPARRAGNEYLFQMFAEENVATLNGYQPKRIVTTCPHCFNMLGEEYKDFGGDYAVVHHTEFLAELVRDGRLRPTHEVPGTVVYHDSCYIGRYHDIYDPPRDVLRAIPGLTVVEAEQSRDRGMCCGAGGAQMWKEDEPGDMKVNHLRTQQLTKALPVLASGGGSTGGGNKVASACPFCMTMLTDGLTDQGHEDVEQMDVAQLLWRSVAGAS